MLQFNNLSVITIQSAIYIEDTKVNKYSRRLSKRAINERTFFAACAQSAIMYSGKVFERICYGGTIPVRIAGNKTTEVAWCKVIKTRTAKDIEWYKMEYAADRLPASIPQDKLDELRTNPRVVMIKVKRSPNNEFININGKMFKI